MMNFNAFQRELANRGIDGPIAIILTQIWEQVLELSKQGDEGAKIMLVMAESMQNVVGLQEHTQEELKEVRKRLSSDDEMFQSVPLRDDN